MNILVKKRETALIVLCWTLFLLIDLTKKSNIDFGSVYFYGYYLPGFLVWIIVTKPLFKIFSRTAKLNILKRVLSLFLLGVLVGAIKVVISASIFEVCILALGGSTNFTLLTQPFYYSEATIIAWVMFIIFVVIETNGRYKKKSLETTQLQAELTKAQLQALRMQIQPHFLFNSLNTIVSLIRSEKHDKGLETLLRLSSLLRISLSHFEDQFVTIREEISFVQQYLEIEKIRFEDRLTIEIDVPAQAAGMKIPALILQPIVENSMKHGANKSLGMILIKVTVTVQEQLTVRVFNSGELLPQNNNTGIGLSNVKQRLSTIYGVEASLEMSQLEDGVNVELSIPKTTTA